MSSSRSLHYRSLAQDVLEFGAYLATLLEASREDRPAIALSTPEMSRPSRDEQRLPHSVRATIELQEPLPVLRTDSSMSADT